MRCSVHWRIPATQRSVSPRWISAEPFDPPADVLAGMRAYLAAMDLCYGCFDLVATPQGILIYECNPAGQYLWLEHATGLLISAGIAALLAKGAV